ncbi:MAG: SDR family NAD(P)-dependent oxidoreductase [Anaerolineales bacterium]
MNERVALVVGAGSPAGQQIARELSSRGFHVALNDQLPDRIEKLASELGSMAITHAADLSRKLSLQTMLQTILEKWGRIDALIFVASIQPTDAILDMDEWDWHRTIDLNLTAAFLCMQSVGRIMRELGGGVIVNVLVGSSNTESPVYEAAATGLRALGDSVQPEFAKNNISLQTLNADEDLITKIAELLRTPDPSAITNTK